MKGTFNKLFSILLVVAVVVLSSAFFVIAENIGSNVEIVEEADCEVFKNVKEEKIVEEEQSKVSEEIKTEELEEKILKEETSKENFEEQEVDETNIEDEVKEEVNSEDEAKEEENSEEVKDEAKEETNSEEVKEEVKEESKEESKEETELEEKNSSDENLSETDLIKGSDDIKENAKNITASGVFNSSANTVMISGSKFNVQVKKLANVDVESSIDSVEYIDYNVEKFIKSDNNNSNAIDISVSGSPIYIWYDNNTVYYYSDSSVGLPEDMSYMFYGFDGLKECDLSEFDLSEVEKMSNAFDGCTELTTLKFKTTGTQTSNLKKMDSIFRCCNSLKEVDLSSFDLSKITNISKAFFNCLNLNKVTITNSWLSLSETADQTDMWTGCNDVTLYNSDTQNGDTMNETDAADITPGDPNNKKYYIYFRVDSEIYDEEVDYMSAFTGEAVTLPTLDKSLFKKNVKFLYWQAGNKKVTAGQTVENANYCSGGPDDCFITFNAVFARGYNIKFEIDKLYSDTTISPITAYFGENVNLPTITNLKQGSFKGWMIEGITYNSGNTEGFERHVGQDDNEVTVIAKFAMEYTIKLSIDPNYTDQVLQPYELTTILNTDDEYSFPKMDDKPYSKFIGWESTNGKYYIKENNPSISYSNFCSGREGDKEITFEAKFEYITYLVNYSINDKYSKTKLEATERVYTKEGITLPVAADIDVNGATLTGWNCAGVSYSLGAELTADVISEILDNNNTKEITFVASFNPKMVNVEFIKSAPNTASISEIQGNLPASMEIEILDTTDIDMSNTNLTLDGCRFEGWSDKPDGCVKIDSEKNEITPLDFINENSGSGFLGAVGDDTIYLYTVFTPNKKMFKKDLNIEGIEEDLKDEIMKKAVNADKMGQTEIIDNSAKLTEEKVNKGNNRNYTPSYSSGGSGGSGGGGGGGFSGGSIPFTGLPSANNIPQAKEPVVGVNSGGAFEYNPVTKTFKYLMFDVNNNRSYVRSDWFTEKNPLTGVNNYYLTNENGEMIIGWAMFNGSFYYLSEDELTKGAMVSGVSNINGINYVFDEKGKYIGDVSLFPTNYVIVNNVAKVMAMNQTFVNGFSGTEERDYTLLQGKELNKKLKSIAAGTEVKKHTVIDENIKAIKVVEDTTQGSSISEKGDITAKFEDGIMYISINDGLINVSEDASYMFSNMPKLETIDLGRFDFTNTRDLTAMFKNCNNLKSVSFASKDLTKVNVFDYMFYGCNSLAKVNFSNIINKYSDSIKYMFYGCENLDIINLSGFVGTKIENAKGAFDFCSNLVYIIIPDENINYSLFQGYTSKVKTLTEYNEIVEEIAESKRIAEEESIAASIKESIRESESIAQAELEARKRTISFYNGNNLLLKDNVYANDSYIIDQVAPPKANYDFVGWDENEDKDPSKVSYFTGDNIVITSNLNLYAIYQPQMKSVHYSYRGEYYTASVPYNNNHTVYNKLPAKAYYRCIGWNTVKNSTSAQYKAGASFKVTKDTILYPVWECTAKFIKEIRCSIKTSSNDCIKDLTNNGFTPIKMDLNKSAGGYYIYIGYTTTNTISEAITGLGARYHVTSFQGDKEYTYNGIRWTAVKGEKSSLFSDSKADMNDGAGGYYINLYYTRDRSLGNPISVIDIINYSNSQNATVIGNYGANEVTNRYEICLNTVENTPQDFNLGCTEFYEKHEIRYKKVLGISIPYPYIEIGTRRNGDYIYIRYKRFMNLDDDLGLPMPTSRSGKNWMAFINNNTHINEINIPGTHDSGTKIMAPTKDALACTQDLSIAEQLNAGVRKFDLRLGVDNGTVKLYHGDSKSIADIDKLKNDSALKEKLKAYFMEDVIGKLFAECNCYSYYNNVVSRKHLTLDDVFSMFLQFLTENPTETILFEIQHESRNRSDYDKYVPQKLQPLIDAGILYVSRTMPLLKDVRGKLVLLDNGKHTKFNNSSIGVAWKDTKQMGTVNSKIDYSNNSQGIIDNVIKKYMNDLNGRKINTQENVMDKYMGVLCTNGYGEVSENFPLPRVTSKNVNAYLSNYNFIKGNYYGWINCDFMTKDLAKKIYNTNKFIND